MATQQLPQEYLEAIRHLGLGGLADAFTSMDERLNGIALLLDSHLSKINQLLSAILAAQGGIPPSAGEQPPSGGQQPPPAVDGRLDQLVSYVNKVPVFWGTASNGGPNTLIHDGQVWEENCWAGYLVSIISGRGVGQTRTVISNRNNTLIVRDNWSQPPDASSVYVLRPSSKSTVSNLNFIKTGQTTVTTAGTAVQLASDEKVPEGFAVVIMAKPTNTGRIFIARSKSIAEDSTSSSQRFDGLTAGLAVSLKVTNLNSIWINSTVNNEGVSWIVEAVS